MKKKALSIIIPVYNVEAYLEQCVKSILDQWTPEVEVILVDDGSTDNSGKLCDKFAAQSKELIVVHQENGGLSAARNTGLRFATGRYITFVDSDDFIGNNSVQKILSWIEGSSSDICFINVWKLFPNGRKELLDVPIPHEMLCKGKLNAVKYLSEMNKYPGSACGKLFRRTFLTQNNLDFPKDRRISEDLGFMRDCILKAERFLPIGRNVAGNPLFFLRDGILCMSAALIILPVLYPFILQHSKEKYQVLYGGSYVTGPFGNWKSGILLVALYLIFYIAYYNNWKKLTEKRKHHRRQCYYAGICLFLIEYYQ